MHAVWRVSGVFEFMVFVKGHPMASDVIMQNDAELQALGLTTSCGRKLKFVRGVQVAAPSDLHEAYTVTEYKTGSWVFTVNVSADRIRSTFVNLVQEVRNPGYFVLEVGTPPQEERALRRVEKDPYHKDVYYRDGISHNWAIDNFNKHDVLFVHDGRTQVGFGSHRGLDEVYLGPYKLFRILTNSPGKYISALRLLQFPREERLRTVWKTFTPQTPGRRNPLPESPALVERTISDLRARGLYFAERRDDSC
jgi:hypothetical protein